MPFDKIFKISSSEKNGFHIEKFANGHRKLPAWRADAYSMVVDCWEISQIEYNFEGVQKFEDKLFLISIFIFKKIFESYHQEILIFCLNDTPYKVKEYLQYEVTFLAVTFLE